MEYPMARADRNGPPLVPSHPEGAVYLVENDFQRFGVAYVETDAAAADRDTVVRNLIAGEYSNPMRVVGFNISEGWCRDVSEEIAGEVLKRAPNADHDLSASTMAFIDRYCGAEVN
jgi:hypothetical protein